jgi:hypothetical protein
VVSFQKGNKGIYLDGGINDEGLNKCCRNKAYAEIILKIF